MSERILITIDITDEETVENYKNIDKELVFEDLLNGNLMQVTNLVDVKVFKDSQ